MSLTSTNIDTLIDANCNTNSKSYPQAQKTIDKNVAMDRALSIIIPASGKAQWDDSNHSQAPIITFDLVDGQRDYNFSTDEEGSLILDINRVMVADANGVFYDLIYKDQQTPGEQLSMVDGRNQEGNPMYYDRTGSGIYLDPIPSYDYTNGIKCFIARESSYFVDGDTTKKPGFAGIFHEYIALRPSWQYAVRKGLKNENYLQQQVLLFEERIKKWYSQRNRKKSPVILSASIINHI